MVDSNAKVNMENTPKESTEKNQKQELCIDSPVLDEASKSHTFRRRRLTLSKHHLSPESSEQSADRNRTFRDRRLSLPHSHSHDDDEDNNSASNTTPRKKLKTTSSATLTSRVNHAGHLPPVSPKTRLSHPLYQAPLRQEFPDTQEDRASQPAWRHRHVFAHDDEQQLPFPRTIVGTYSCHGVEPVYDSEYEEEEWQEENDKNDSSPTNDDEKVTAKINQDRGGVAYPYANSSKMALFAAYDGHGQGGELVSQYALHEVQKRLEQHALFQVDVETAFKEIFVQVDQDLKREPLIEPLYAGTTACVVLVRDKQLVIANAGDSRAVLARRSSKDDYYKAIDLSQDQNPDNPEEQERIEKSGGFVSPPPEPGLSARVWLDDSYSQIGLAMARSIGDHAVAAVGVIAEPVVTFHTIEEDDDFMILATDGVWEFIDSDEAVRIVAKHLQEEGGATKACQALIEASASKWHEEEGNYRDDITALVVRLQDLWGKEASTSEN